MKYAFQYHRKKSWDIWSTNYEMDKTSNSFPHPKNFLNNSCHSFPRPLFSIEKFQQNDKTRSFTWLHLHQSFLVISAAIHRKVSKRKNYLTTPNNSQQATTKVGLQEKATGRSKREKRASQVQAPNWLQAALSYIFNFPQYQFVVEKN